MSNIYSNNCIFLLHFMAVKVIIISEFYGVRTLLIFTTEWPPKPFECYHVIEYCVFIGYLLNIRWSVSLQIHIVTFQVRSLEINMLNRSWNIWHFSQTKIIIDTKVFKTFNCYTFFVTNRTHFCTKYCWIKAFPQVAIMKSILQW